MVHQVPFILLCFGQSISRLFTKQCTNYAVKEGDGEIGVGSQESARTLELAVRWSIIIDIGVEVEGVPKFHS